MELIELVDFEGETRIINASYIIAINPFFPVGRTDNRRSRVDYGSGWMDSVYMKENLRQVYNLIRDQYNDQI